MAAENEDDYKTSTPPAVRLRLCGESGYTLGMDSVRFGRALGMGARAAAKTLVTAVDAAAAPNPSAARKAQPEQKTTGKAAASGERMGQQVARSAAQAVETGKGLKRGGRRFGQAVWTPFVKLSGVLWLEMTGAFFGIFALFAVGGAWKMRAALHETALNQRAHERFVWAVVMAAVFAYFCVTSFMKAHRRGRGR